MKGTNRYGLRGLLAALCAIVYASGAWAGGAYLYEISATDVGLGSAGWTARAQDASTIFSNPAGLTRLEGPELVVTITPIYLQTEFTPDPVRTTTMGTDGDASDWLPAGGVFYARGLSENVTFGVGFGGYFGLALDYEDTWVGRYYVQEVQLQSLAIEPAVAFRASERWSVGVGLAFQYGIFRQTVAINNTPIFLPGNPQPDGRLEIDTTDWTVQGNLGVLFEASDDTRFGLQYLTSADLDFADVPQFSDVRPALEAALRLAGVWDTELNVGMKMPQALRFGFYHALGERWALQGDVGWEDWSRFGKVEILLARDDATRLTADRHYEDVWHVALGAQHGLSDNWTLNFGTAYDSSMVEDVDRTPDLPLGASVRLGVGAERRYGNGAALAFAYEIAAGGDLPLDVNRGELAGRVAGEYEGAAIHFLSVTWRKSF
jgi:long-chain fatty acid transport protein